MRPPLLVVLAAATALAGAACAHRTVSTGGEGPVATSPAAASPSNAPGPTLTIPEGPPPATLQIQDLRTGTGPRAKKGDTVTVNYVGVAWSTGKQFDSSWARGQPLAFPLGVGKVIPGWDRGVAGMRVGGRRELIIPPAQAYGAQGYPPAIGPNETLVFVIDLLAVKK